MVYLVLWYEASFRRGNPKCWWPAWKPETQMPTGIPYHFILQEKTAWEALVQVHSGKGSGKKNPSNSHKLPGSKPWNTFLPDSSSYNKIHVHHANPLLKCRHICRHVDMYVDIYIKPRRLRLKSQASKSGPQPPFQPLATHEPRERTPLCRSYSPRQACPALHLCTSENPPISQR